MCNGTHGRLDSATRMLASAVHTRAKLSCQSKQTWAVADDDEDECEDVADCDTCLVGSFKTPPGHLLQPPPEQVRNGLKGKKIAYKFEIEWEVGTFKCMYKGKNSKYKGHAT